MTGGAEDNLSASLRAAILDYLKGRREAADTKKGIAVFWISKVKPKPSPEELEAVLDSLVAEGKITGTELPDGDTLYSSVEKSGK